MAEYRVKRMKREIESEVTDPPPPRDSLSESDSVPLVDVSILKDKRVMLVRDLDVQTVLAGLKPFLQYVNIDAIDAEINRGDKVRKLCDILQRISYAKYGIFNAFLRIVGGTQPDLFSELVGRYPSEKEADFCIQKYAETLKETIKGQGHCPDSSLDEKIDLSCEHVQLAIKKDNQGCGASEDMPHNYQSHLSSIQHKEENIVEMLDDAQHQQKPTRISMYGRAGTGKTTTFQWLAREWSFSRWAPQFTVLFLIQLRMLSISDCDMTALELLTLASLYQVTDPGLVIPLSSWLKHAAGKIVIFIDGLDEVSGFTARLNNCPKISDLNQRAHPIDLCLNILSGNLLSGCTVVTASRPFTGLSEVHFDKQFEILGLTESRVEEFVKRKHPPKAAKIMSVLKGSPLLMSVCGITFYCALISRLVSEGVNFDSDELKTYTRLMAFLIVQCAQRKFSDWSFVIQVSSYFHKLARIAYVGVFERQLNGEMAKLVFNDYDIGREQFTPQELKSIQEVGLLQMKKVKVGLRESVIAEFFNLSIQEMLASAYLLSHLTHTNMFKQLFSEGQFNMALLYLFGLKHDTESVWIKDIRFVVDPSEQGSWHNIDAQIEDYLGCLCKKTGEVTNFKLQLCQILHEGQMEEKAKSVASYVAPNGVLSMDNMNMTLIDLMAVRFVCKHAEAICSIGLSECSMTDNLIDFMASSLLQDHAKTLHDLYLHQNLIGQRGAEAIGKWLQQNHSLKTLDLGVNQIGENGAKALGKALQNNGTLVALYVHCNKIGDSGAKALGQALCHNTALQTLHVYSNDIGVEGVKSMGEALHSNNTLQTLDVGGNTIGPNGGRSLGEALRRNKALKTLDVTMSYIGDSGAKSLGESLHHNSTLQMLGVGGNNIGVNGARALGEALRQNKTLQTLHLGANNIGDDGAKALGEALHHNNTLQVLHVYTNNIGAKGDNALDEALHGNSTLSIVKA